ncbi:MAG: hypothetical protein WBG11_14040 [Methylocella sp.]
MHRRRKSIATVGFDEIGRKRGVALGMGTYGRAALDLVQEMVKRRGAEVVKELDEAMAAEPEPLPRLAKFNLRGSLGRLIRLKFNAAIA